MKKINFLFSFMMIFALLFAGCSEDDEVSSEALLPSMLKYAETGNAYQGKALETPRPLIQSTSIPIFSIESGSASEGGEYIDGVFEIADSTGVITLPEGNPLIAGFYSLNISVENNAGSKTFENAYSVKILPAKAEGLVYGTGTPVMVRGTGDATEAPTFKGTQPATFALEGDTEFTINSETGAISLPAESLLDAGSYSLSVTVTNEAGTVTFENAVAIQLETTPYNLVYEPNQINGIETEPSQSGIPGVEGTSNEENPIVFSLADNYSGNFSIDESNGRISLMNDHTLAAGTYALDVIAANKHGETLFEGAITFDIIELVELPASNLLYNPDAYTVFEGYGFTSAQPTVEGTTPITYSLADDFGALTIDSETGIITLADGHSLTAGTYSIDVVATNTVDAITFTGAATLEVKAAVIEQVFIDGWEGLSPAAGETRLGNMKQVSLEGTPVQADNNRWEFGWGNWTVQDVDGLSARGANMVPKRSNNDDWLIAEYVDLTNHAMAELYLAGYSRYGTNDNNSLTLVVSTDYMGDVTTATWTEVPFESIHNYTSAQARIVDLSAFDGEVITIALRQTTIPTITDTGEEDYTNCTRTTSIWRFAVNALSLQ
ncbi:surface glycan-binding family protein [Marinilabilia salmonicolor]|jgi:hypothetical protein|uniref:Uncharacterized protein DUF4958 n=1 Tax=Marinilabilia salmonicolor TaxID=989 RepID=A0A368VD70_9BACT|nr:surface glycan-binding family protein [Marinilabilia salmonicolor]RCW37594.1 uncharacterized protein DUF4958 [Marinilabilia salmonicolor]